jgi:hypothetical protein
MDTKKKDNTAPTTEPSAETTTGAHRLRLSVTRMKKLRSSVKGGGGEAQTNGSTANSTLSWASLGNEIDRDADRPLSRGPTPASNPPNPGGWGGHLQRVVRALEHARPRPDC